LILGTLSIPQKDLLNENNASNIASVLSVEVTPTFLTTAPPLCLNIIYERLILIAIYHINFLVTVSDFYLILVPLPVSTTYEDEATINIL
jgi:hypothetical protein